jgi:hypothetical protein
MMPDVSSGELPERLRQAIEKGSMTQEQLEQIQKGLEKGLAPGEGLGRMGQGGITRGSKAIEDIAPKGVMPEAIQLREGLTVTVSILVDERSDVVLVPNAAITSRGMETYVQVVSEDGSTAERLIQTGISDWQYTEVTDGLGEGEKVIVPTGTATTTTTQQDRKPIGGIPGMGRMIK